MTLRPSQHSRPVYAFLCSLPPTKNRVPDAVMAPMPEPPAAGRR